MTENLSSILRCSRNVARPEHRRNIYFLVGERLRVKARGEGSPARAPSFAAREKWFLLRVEIENYFDYSARERRKATGPVASDKTRAGMPRALKITAKTNTIKRPDAEPRIESP